MVELLHRLKVALTHINLKPGVPREEQPFRKRPVFPSVSICSREDNDFPSRVANIYNLFLPNRVNLKSERDLAKLENTDTNKVLISISRIITSNLLPLIKKKQKANPAEIQWLEP